MKKAAIIILGILILGFITIQCWPQSGKSKKPPTEHAYVLTGDLNTWVYTYNYLAKVQAILLRSSDLPSKQVTALNDTLDMIKLMIVNQLDPQVQSFHKEDSIASLKHIKDTTNKK